MEDINNKQFQDPWKLISWCLMNPLEAIVPVNENGNENYNNCQTLKEVLESRTINCVDASIIFHQLLSKLKYPHVIIWMKWIIDEKKTVGHFMPIFYNGSYNVVQFRSVKYCYIKPYTTISEAIEKESKQIKDEIDFKLCYRTKQLVAVLNQPYLDIIDNIEDITKIRQIDLIRMFGKLDPFNGEWIQPQTDQSEE